MANIKQKYKNAIKNIKRGKTNINNGNKFQNFYYIFANEISIKFFSTKKQKETTMKTSTISQKSQLTPIDFVELYN